MRARWARLGLGAVLVSVVLSLPGGMLPVRQARPEHPGSGLSLLSSPTLQRLVGAERNAWFVDASPERQTDPRTDERYWYLALHSVQDWTAPVLQPRWLPADLKDVLQYEALAEGLEALERDALWARYACEGAEALVVGRFRQIAVMIVPDHPPAPFEVCAQAQAVLDEAGQTPWPGAPADVRQALFSVWEQHVVQAAASAPPTMCSYFGLPAARARLRAGAMGSVDCLLFCDGHAVGILITKPPGIWHDYITHQYEPTPREPPATPRNPDMVLYEDTCLYRDRNDRWVSDLRRASTRLVRLVSRGFPGAPAGTSILFALPTTDETVPGSTWDNCESYFIAASLLKETGLAVARTQAHEGGPAGEDAASARRRDAQHLADVEAAVSAWHRSSIASFGHQTSEPITEALEASLAACHSTVAAGDQAAEAEAAAALTRARQLIGQAQEHLSARLADSGATRVRGVYSDW